MTYAQGETPLEVGEDGKIIVDREEAEVFRPETLASFEGKSITIGHPDEFVGPSNWKELAKGTVQNVRRGKGDQSTDLIADLMITDEMAIGLVRNGLREVSCGYEADYVQTGKGRGTQKKLVGNHLALVDQGRAGSSYAINDQKPKETEMKLSEKIKAIFAKAQDEAMKAAQNGDADVTSGKPNTEGQTAADAPGMDAVMKAVGDLSAKVDKMMAGKDASTPPDVSSGAPAKVDAVDEPVNAGLEDRLKALEASVSKLLEASAPAGDEGEDDDEEEGETGDEDEDDEGSMVGDTASRVEILAPGLKSDTKDAKVKALKAAYATKDGKAVIDALTGGKPSFDKPKSVETLFIAASEVLKMQRSDNLAGTKTSTKQTRDYQSHLGTPQGAMTPDQQNALNAEHYARKA